MVETEFSGQLSHTHVKNGHMLHTEAQLNNK